MARAALSTWCSPGKRGPRQVVQGVLVLEDQTVALAPDIEAFTQAIQAHAQFKCLAFQRTLRLIGLARRQGGDTWLEDAGFFACDLRQFVAEEGLVIIVDRRDQGQFRTGDDIGGVQGAAEAGFQQQQVRRGLAEGEEGRGGGRLKEGQGLAGIGLFDPVQDLGKTGFVDQDPGQADAFSKAHQVRAGIDMDAQPLRFGDGAQEGDGRALAIGAGDVDRRRQSILGVAQGLADPQHAFEIEIDQLGVKGFQPFKRRIEGQKAVGHGAILGRFGGCVYLEQGSKNS